MEPFHKINFTEDVGSSYVLVEGSEVWEREQIQHCLLVKETIVAYSS